MARPVQRRDTPDTIRSLRDRVFALERELGRGGASAAALGNYFEVLFDYKGGSAPSKRYYPPFSADLVELFGSLTDDGSTGTDVDLLIDGGAQETLTIPASAFSERLRVTHGFATRADYMQLTATLGTGADGLLVSALFRRRG